MAISYVGNGSYAVNATTATQAITAPTLQANDIMIAIVANKQISNAISAPDGTWTQIYQGENSNLNTHSAWWKLAGAGDSGASFTFSKASDDNVVFGGVICAFRGVHTTSPLDATAANRQNTTSAADDVSFPTFDPTSTDVELVYVAFYGNDLTDFSTVPAGTNPTFTLRFDVETSTGSDFSLAMCSGNNDGTSVTGRTWASASTTNATSTGMVFALVPSGATSSIKTINGLAKASIKTVDDLAIASVKTWGGLA